MTMTPEEVRLAGLDVARRRRRNGLVGLLSVPLGLAMVAGAVMGWGHDWWAVLVCGAVGLLVVVSPFHSLYRAQVIRRGCEVWDPVRCDIEALPPEVRAAGVQGYWSVEGYPGAFDPVARGWIRPWHLVVGWAAFVVVAAWALLRTAIGLMGVAGGNWAGGIALFAAAVWWAVALVLLRVLLGIQAERRQHRRRAEHRGPVDEVRPTAGPWIEGGPQA